MTSTDQHVQEDDIELVRAQILSAGKGGTEEELQALLKEYRDGKPLAYITGLHTFGSLSMVIRPPVYIPRVETEQWVLSLAHAILSNTTAPTIRILDICSGSGCIPLVLAHQGHGRIRTVGLEVDERALSVARDNAKRNGIDHLSEFRKFDLFEGDIEGVKQSLGHFDMVISNPPYVSSADMRKINGTWWESTYALQGKLAQSNGKGNDDDAQIEDDGLSFYRRIKEIYASFLSPDRPSSIPKLVLEVGSTQSSPVRKMFEKDGRQEIHKEAPRRKDFGAPKLEEGDMVGTERCLWIYDD